MTFKDISYLELLQPFCSVEWNGLCNFGRGYHEKQSCEIILNLDQWFRRGFCLNDFLCRALTVLVLCNFGRGHYWEHSYEIILNLDQWLRRRCRLRKSLWTRHYTQKPITIAHIEPSAQVS